MVLTLFRTVLAGLTLSWAIAVPAAELRPFTATYSVTWRGMAAGTSELHLEKLSGSEWAYSSRSHARGVFRMALPGDVGQRSTFVIHDGHVRPHHFRSGMGNDAKAAAELTFDWESGRVTGSDERRPVDMPLEPGVQDAMSIQVSLMHALLAGRTPERFQMIDGDRIKEYVYTREGEETVQTPAGPRRTVIFRSNRPGMSRGTLFWCAPELNYLPVKVERRNGQKVEWSMRLVEARIDPA